MKSIENIKTLFAGTIVLGLVLSMTWVGFSIIGAMSTSLFSIQEFFTAIGIVTIIIIFCVLITWSIDRLVKVLAKIILD